MASQNEIAAALAATRGRIMSAIEQKEQQAPEAEAYVAEWLAFVGNDIGNDHFVTQLASRYVGIRLDDSLCLVRGRGSEVAIFEIAEDGSAPAKKLSEKEAVARCGGALPFGELVVKAMGRILERINRQNENDRHLGAALERLREINRAARGRSISPASDL